MRLRRLVKRRLHPVRNQVPQAGPLQQGGGSLDSVGDDLLLVRLLATDARAASQLKRIVRSFFQ